MRSLICLFLLAHLLAVTAFAEDDQPVALRVYWENDGIFNPVGSQDRHYTNALAVTLVFRADAADDFWTWLGDRGQATAMGLVFGQQMYTPEDIASPVADPDDQPYAGYLYTGLYLQRQVALEPDVSQLDHLELNVGVVGQSSLAEQVQTDIHEGFDEQVPGGWNNQLHDEPALQLFARRKWRADLFTQQPDPRGLQLQLIPQLGAALGTVRVALEGAALLRLGVNLPDDFGPGRIWDLQSATGIGNDQRPGLSVYGFVGAGGRLVAWDTFLDGNIYHDSPSVDREPVVGEARTGLVAGYRVGNWTVQASYGITFTTDRFEQQDTNDSYATVMLGAVGRF